MWQNLKTMTTRSFIKKNNVLGINTCLQGCCNEQTGLPTFQRNQLGFGTFGKSKITISMCN